MSSSLVPCKGSNQAECIATALEAEAAFETVMRFTHATNDQGQIAARWRELAETYDQTLASLPPEAPQALALRLGVLGDRARRLGAQHALSHARSRAGADGTAGA